MKSWELDDPTADANPQCLCQAGKYEVLAMVRSHHQAVHRQGRNRAGPREKEGRDQERVTRQPKERVTHLRKRN